MKIMTNMTSNNKVPPKTGTSQTQGKIFISGFRDRRNKFPTVLGVENERAVAVVVNGPLLCKERLGQE